MTKARGLAQCEALAPGLKMSPVTFEVLEVFAVNDAGKL
jgi:hypothetical protein